MPNSRTFTIQPILDLIKKYDVNGLCLDLFANEHSIKNSLSKCKYVSNDIDEIYKCDYSLEANDFMAMYDDNSVDLILFDPPYSGRQVSECYTKLGKTVTMNDTNGAYWSKLKLGIQRILKPGGVCITCCWNSNGIGGNKGFDITEILLVAHGGGHNDTIVTVEKKQFHQYDIFQNETKEARL